MGSDIRATELIAEALGARISTGLRGTSLSFQRDDQWHTLTVRESPRLELSLPAPGLVGLTLRASFGDAPLIGGQGRSLDPHWKLRASDLERAIALFEEAPWPEGDRYRNPHQTRDAGIGLGVLGLFVVAPLIGLGVVGFLVARHTLQRKPGYLLTVEDEVATLEQFASDTHPIVPVRMAERLIQVVTRPARLEAEIASLAMRDHETNAPYR